MPPNPVRLRGHDALTCGALFGALIGSVRLRAQRFGAIAHERSVAWSIALPRDTRVLTVASVALPRPSHAQQPACTRTARRAREASRPQSRQRASSPWLRLRGEFRERLEGFDGLGFNSTREDLYWLSRLRLNATVTPSKQLSFQAQVQDARVAKKTVGPDWSPVQGADRPANGVSRTWRSSTGPMTIRAGRQELVYGEQRLVGHVSWLNAARTFDGVKATFRTKAFAADVFATSVVRILDGEFDKSGNGNRFAGVYGTTAKLIPLATVEPTSCSSAT